MTLLCAEQSKFGLISLSFIGTNFENESIRFDRNDDDANDNCNGGALQCLKFYAVCTDHLECITESTSHIISHSLISWGNKRMFNGVNGFHSFPCVWLDASASMCSVYLNILL